MNAGSYLRGWVRVWAGDSVRDWVRVWPGERSDALWANSVRSHRQAGLRWGPVRWLVAWHAAHAARPARRRTPDTVSSPFRLRLAVSRSPDTRQSPLLPLHAHFAAAFCALTA